MIPPRLEPVSSVQEFMEGIWSNPAPPGTGAKLFRGQANDWPLLPKLFRLGRSHEDLKRLGERLLAEFRVRCLYLLPSTPWTDYDMMSLAQHYGLATPLLDWSSNPLMALYFAVETPTPKCPMVWIFDAPEAYVQLGRSLNNDNSLYLGNPTLVIRPVPHSHRVAAQAGWHTLHDLGMSDDSRRTRVIQKPGLRVQPMNESKDAQYLTAISVEPQRATEIKKELRDMGIHAATVYGDLASVCREIQNDLGIPAYMRHGTDDHR
jgi:hypothetical protein